MSDKAMPLGKKFKVRLTITPEENRNARGHAGIHIHQRPERAYGTGHRVQQHSQTG